MGFTEQFDYENAYSIFNEHVMLSGLENNQTRLFDLSALANMGAEQFDALQPVQWPITAASPAGTERLFGDGCYSTEDQKAQLIAVEPRQPASKVNHNQLLILNTGRVRDHWNTMTRSGKSARLSSHRHEPFVEIHPSDAALAAIDDQQITSIRNELGAIQVRAHLSEDQKPGHVFVPIHWNRQFCSNARVDKLVKAAVDPVSGQPEFKHAVVSLEPIAYRWYGFVLSRQDNLQPEEYAEYWNKSRGHAVWRYELAGNKTPNSKEAIHHRKNHF